MVAIAASDLSGSGDKVVTETTLTSSDTLTYNPTKDPVLEIENGTGAELTVNLDGDGASTVQVQGVGSVDISGGYDVVVADGETRAIKLNAIGKYLQGTVAVTGGLNAVARLLEF